MKWVATGTLLVGGGTWKVIVNVAHVMLEIDRGGMVMMFGSDGTTSSDDDSSNDDEQRGKLPPPL